MTEQRDRQLVYIALFAPCAAMAFAAGPVAGILTYIQIGAVFELTSWIGTPRGKNLNRHR